MKRLMFDETEAAHFSAVGVTLQPGMNRLGDEHALEFLRLAAAGVKVRVPTPAEAARAETDEKAEAKRAADQADKDEKAAAAAAEKERSDRTAEDERLRAVLDAPFKPSPFASSTPPPAARPEAREEER